MSYEKSICHLRWGYPNISLTRSEIRTCCKTPFQSVSENDMKEYGINLFLNTNYQKQRRLEMFKGVRHKDCGSCWQVEDQGASSLRGNSPRGFEDFARHTGMLNEFPGQTMSQIAESVTLESVILNSHRPFMLEVSLGNTCDMKCMYCNHIYSSQWSTESVKNNTISIREHERAASKPDPKFLELFWQWVDLEAKHSVNRIGIIGGEPLITPEFYDFLDKLLETYSNVPHNNTAIWIVTNMNTPENYFRKFTEYLPKLLEKFKVEIHISMESLGPQAEYIRNGIVWDRFVKNVNKIFEYSSGKNSIELAFLPSITALSIPRFHEFLKWVYELVQRYNKPAMLKQNIVTWPQPHTPFILPNHFADYLDPAIEWMQTIQNTMPDFNDHFGRWNKYTEFLINLRNGIKNSAPATVEQRRKFYEWFSAFDLLRNINFTETFPELAQFYNECKTT